MQLINKSKAIKNAIKNTQDLFREFPDFSSSLVRYVSPQFKEMELRIFFENNLNECLHKRDRDTIQQTPRPNLQCFFESNQLIRAPPSVTTVPSKL
jgi:hypothetical protein